MQLPLLASFKRVSNDSGLGYLVANAAATFGINSAVELALKGRVGLPATSNLVRGLTFVTQLALIFFIIPQIARSQGQSEFDVIGYTKTGRY